MVFLVREVASFLVANCLVHFSLGIIFFEGLALVVVLLTFTNADFDLGIAIFEVEGKGNKRITRLSDLAVDLVYLMAIQKQLALAPSGVVGPGSVEKLWDVNVLQVDLTIFN